MEFCCDRFKSYYEDNSTNVGQVLIERFPSIKIVKLPSVTGEKIDNPYRYLFVCGLIKDKPPLINMAHCPFCGTNLFKFYNKDAYINEDSDHFF